MVSMLKGLFAAVWAGGGETGSSAHPNHQKYLPEETSCPSWPIPNPIIRLQVLNDSLRIYGYPKELPYETQAPSYDRPGPPFLYLRGDTPAYVDHVMGKGWRDLLEDRDDEEGQVILRPFVGENLHDSGLAQSDEDEESHCLRMRQCGAVLVSSQPDIAFRDSAFSDPIRQPSERQIFGWPPNGGVWVLRAPSTAHELSLEEQLEKLNSDPDGQAQMNYERVSIDIRSSRSMEDVCEVLRNAGAQYYTDAEDCPEVRALELST